jgi:hypothetical protein
LVQYDFQIRNVIHFMGAALLQVGRHIANGLVLTAFQGMETLGIRGICVINPSEEQVVVVVKLVPQTGVGGQSH